MSLFEAREARDAQLEEAVIASKLADEEARRRRKEDAAIASTPVKAYAQIDVARSSSRPDDDAADEARWKAKEELIRRQAREDLEKRQAKLIADEAERLAKAAAERQAELELEAEEERLEQETKRRRKEGRLEEQRLLKEAAVRKAPQVPTQAAASRQSGSIWENLRRSQASLEKQVLAPAAASRQSGVIEEKLRRSQASLEKMETELDGKRRTCSRKKAEAEMRKLDAKKAVKEVKSSKDADAKLEARKITKAQHFEDALSNFRQAKTEYEAFQAKVDSARQKVGELRTQIRKAAEKQDAA